MEYIKGIMNEIDAVVNETDIELLKAYILFNKLDACIDYNEYKKDVDKNSTNIYGTDEDGNDLPFGANLDALSKEVFEHYTN